IYASQSFSLTNSTLTGNSTGANTSGGTATISHVTVSGNASGIIGTGGTLNVDHALVTNNTSYGVYVSSSDYNTAAPCDHDDIWGNGSGGTLNSYNISVGSGEL